MLNFLCQSRVQFKELTFRLSVRAGFFLGADTKNRKDISEHMRRAYDVRSKIVHGSSKLPLPQDTSGRQLTLSEFVAITERYVRSALHKFILLASEANASTELVDWEDLVFAAKDN